VREEERMEERAWRVVLWRGEVSRGGSGGMGRDGVG
jgi:hypothetical protein